MAKKKTNPRRIPLAKKEINKDEILHEATQGKMNDAWILVASELYDQGYRNLSELNEAVSAYSNPGKHRVILYSTVHAGDEPH